MSIYGEVYDPSLHRMKQDTRLARLDAYAQVMQKTDRILTGKPINVSVVEDRMGLDAPAWSTGDDIFLDKEKMLEAYDKYANDPVKFLLKFKGGNYHELCHAIYTPRRNDEIVTWLNQQTNVGLARQAFNFLEDARIEMMFVSVYTASIQYFESAVYEWVMRTPASVDKAHLLVHGRKYLSVEFRDAVRAAYVSSYNQKQANEVSDVIDKYLHVVYPTNVLLAKRLITRFMYLLTDTYGHVPPQAGNAPGGCIHVTSDVATGSSGQASKAAQKDALTKQDEYDWDAPSGSDDGDDGDADSAGGDSGSGTSSGGQDSGSSKSDPSDSSGKADGTTDSGECSGGSGVSAGDGSADTDGVFDAASKAVDQAARDAMQDILNDPQLRQDVKNVQHAVSSILTGDAEANGALAQHQMVAPLPGTLGIVRKVRTTLRQLQLDLEPTWHKGEVHGQRINMRRYMLRQPHEVDVFNRWDEGREDEGGVELVMVVDLSGSMSGVMDKLSAVLWVLKRAFDELGFRTTVIGYSNQHYVLYKHTDRVKKNVMPRFSAHASTHPTGALKEAHRLLAASHQANKVLISLTDGQWPGMYDALNINNQIVSAIRQLGARTMLLGLQNAVREYGAHNHEVAHDLHDLNDLPKIVQKLVAEILRNVATA